MIDQINTLLIPLENILKSYKKYIRYFFLLLAFASFWFFWNDDGVKESWEKALLVLWIILWIPIFARVFGIRVFQLFLPLRKELGILMGTLAFVHAGLVIFPSPQFLLSPYFWLSDTTFFSYLAVWFLALILSCALTLTSNIWMMRKMWRYWKVLHRSAYVLIVLVVIHVVLIEWVKYIRWEPVVLLIAYFCFKILEWSGYSCMRKEEYRQE